MKNLFKKTCPFCEGRGYRYYDTTEDLCSTCRATGYVPLDDTQKQFIYMILWIVAGALIAGAEGAFFGFCIWLVILGWLSIK